MKTYTTELKNGVLIFLGITLYFTLIDLLGQSDNPFLRLFNGLFVIYGVNKTIKSRIQKGKTRYLNHLFSTTLTAFVGVGLSVLALGIYLAVFKPAGHIAILADSILMSATATTGIWEYCVSLFIEGFTSSAIIGYILMQRWKNVQVLQEI